MCEHTRILGVDRDGAFAQFVAVPESVIWKNDRAKLPPEIATLQEPFGNAVSRRASRTSPAARWPCSAAGRSACSPSRSPARPAPPSSSRPTARRSGSALAETMGAHATVDVARRRRTPPVVPRAQRGPRLRRRLRDVRLAARDRRRLPDRPQRRARAPVRHPVAAGRDRRRRVADLQEPGRSGRERPAHLRHLVQDALAARERRRRPAAADHDELPLDDFDRAFEQLEAGEACKIVVYPAAARPRAQQAGAGARRAGEASAEPAGGRTDELAGSARRRARHAPRGRHLQALQTLASPQGPSWRWRAGARSSCSRRTTTSGSRPARRSSRPGSRGLRRYGAGTGSVRFICGTFEPHLELERELADFSGTDASLTYVSCWNANEAAIPTLTDENTVILSDELNHASIIDAIRLSRPARKVIYSALVDGRAPRRAAVVRAAASASS